MWTTFSSPVMNMDSPRRVAMNPSRLCARWPIVNGLPAAAPQSGR